MQAVHIEIFGRTGKYLFLNFVRPAPNKRTTYIGASFWNGTKEWGRPMTFEELPGRIRDKIAVNEGTGCWEWKGSKSTSGYGRLTLNGNSNTIAHRYIFSLTFKIELTPDQILRSQNIHQVVARYGLMITTPSLDHLEQLKKLGVIPLSRCSIKGCTARKEVTTYFLTTLTLARLTGF